MAVGVYSFPEIRPIKGIRLGSASAGIKSNDRHDIAVIELCEHAHCSAVFTQNAFAAAPVTVARTHLANSNIRWLLINAGNANAGTGRQGIADAVTCCEALANLGGGASKQVLPFSTGVIGETLPTAKIIKALPNAIDSLSETGWRQVAEAIMTTDTRPKGASIKIDLDNAQAINISGVVKGAGMIHPNMATMLSFIGTDANLSPSLINECLTNAVNQSFNRLTVDGDTSTNDACVLIATGNPDTAEITRSESQSYRQFADGLQALCEQLALAVIRDGEGVTKVMRINVSQAISEEEARQVANTVAQSPLVKTALFASDPNWGRILAAVGRAGVDNLDIHRINISLGDTPIVTQGERSAGYTEEKGQAAMAGDEVSINIALSRGQSDASMIGCDLSYDYVRINAEYRT